MFNVFAGCTWSVLMTVAAELLTAADTKGGGAAREGSGDEED